jgi:hypothetical protein
MLFQVSGEEYEPVVFIDLPLIGAFGPRHEQLLSGQIRKFVGAQAAAAV